MKPLEQNEIFQNLNGFLKTRGIELKEGSYAQGIQKSCELLTNAINLGHQSWEKARVELDKSLEQMRQAIHEKTAPKTASTAAASDSKKETTGKPRAKAKPARTTATGSKKTPRRRR